MSRLFPRISKNDLTKRKNSKIIDVKSKGLNTNFYFTNIGRFSKLVFIERSKNTSNGAYMETEEIKMKYPIGFEISVHMTKEEMEHHIRLMAALKMFELGKVSTGKAAQLAGMSRTEFLETCGRYRVSVFNYSPEEVEREIREDLQTARKLTDQ
jgi:predicted HTH domain antitoxin